MDLTSLTVLLWQVCLIEALICLILLVGIILATSRWRIAIRRAVAGVKRGAVSGADRGAGAGADRGAGALKRFSSAMAEYAMYFKRSTSAVLGILGYAMSSLTKRRKRRAGVPERFSSEMAEYAAHLKNHANTIHSLSQASQELREEVSRQHRILSDLLTAIEQAPARVDPGVEPKVKTVISEKTPPIEEEIIAEPEKGLWIPGHFQRRRQPVKEQEIAAKEAPTKRPSLATRHTLATKEALANKARLISTR